MFKLDAEDPTPLYAQLERAIRAAISSGALAVDAQLPTVRQLAVDLRVNANTVAKVYAALERAGVVETRRGVGTFVVDAPVTKRTRTERDQALRAIEDRFLAEIGALGMSASDAIEHLAQRIGRRR